MKKTLIAMAVLGAASGFAMAASNVTLYGIIETGVVLQKAKHQDATVEMRSSFDQGSRWGIKGTEDLGNGYSVGFILEQGFNSDDGTEANQWKKGTEKQNGVFNRESILNVKGGFGSLAFGRTGSLSSGAQSQTILTGWALGTGFGLSSWTSAIGTSFGRVNNALSYATPTFAGFSVHAMYSNGTTVDTAKWSENNHYYGLGLKYQEGAIKSSLIFEATDGKDAVAPAKKEKTIAINYGLEYNLGAWTPMFAYQFATKDGGNRTHMFGLSSKVSVGGGDALIGARYLFGDTEYNTANEESVRSWNVGAAYIYPLSKRTALKAYAGYADSSKGWKDKGLNSDQGLRINDLIFLKPQ